MKQTLSDKIIKMINKVVIDCNLDPCTTKATFTYEPYISGRNVFRKSVTGNSFVLKELVLTDGELLVKVILHENGNYTIKEITTTLSIINLEKVKNPD